MHIYEDYDDTAGVGQSILDDKLTYKNYMDNGIGKLSWVNVKSAVIYGLVLGLGAMFAYGLSIGDFWALNWHVLLNTGGFALIGSILKNLLTTNSGNFIGLVKTSE